MQEAIVASLDLISNYWGLLTMEKNNDSIAGVSFFEKGDKVQLRSDPELQGVITGIVDGPVPRYLVFIDGKEQSFYASQLCKLEVGKDKDVTRLNAKGLRAFLTSQHLLSHSLTSLFSLRQGRVNFVPYQYRPVLKLIRSDRPRLLIADEVGVGKTIEAGLIIKELRARMDVQSVLVLCPKVLVAERKWKDEMRRFEEIFFQVDDGKTLRHCLREARKEGIWPRNFSESIIPFSLLSANLSEIQELKILNSQPTIDILIVDEAHHVRNTHTNLHHAVKQLSNLARAVIFLTATPVHVGNDDLFTLLNMLRPDLVIDRNTFQKMSEPNKFINEAVGHCRSANDNWKEKSMECIECAGRTEWGKSYLRNHPDYIQVRDVLNVNSVLNNEDRIHLISDIENLHTFRPLINRTRRRDIGDFTSRIPQTLQVEYTPAQREFYDDLIGIIERILRHTHGQQYVKFMMTTILHQASSCLYGLVPMLRDLLHNRIDKLEAMEATDSDIELPENFIDAIKDDVGALLMKAEHLANDDPKALEFIKCLIQKNKLQNNKVLVFSFFRHSLAYISDKVKNAGLRYGLVHGDVSHDQRKTLRNRFRLHKDDPEALDVLLTSEVGGEGLDFEFCDMLVNYDLPWNPMRIEQRIGRLDRYGQKSESITIVNMITKDTIDADIYDRCLKRIGVFNSSIGGSEEILGDITQKIRRISGDFELTRAERLNRLNQIADNTLRQLQEENELERNQGELFSLSVPDQLSGNELKDSESVWLSSSLLQDCVSEYLREISGSDDELIRGKGAEKTIRLNQAIRDRLQSDYQSLSSCPSGPTCKDWESIISYHVDPAQKYTFDHEVAVADSNIIYLNVSHPLMLQAAEYHFCKKNLEVSLSVKSEEIDPGKYPFILYRWKKTGIRNDEIIRIISTEMMHSELKLRHLLEIMDTTTRIKVSPECLRAIEHRHYNEWMNASVQHTEDTRKIVLRRKQSLGISHDYRCKLLQSQIDEANVDKIIRMRQGELHKAIRDYETQVKEMDSLVESADIHFTELLVGVIKISGS